MSSLPRIACMTMVKDDVEFLDIWVKYYSGLFGAVNCYVIDHGSQDTSAIDRAKALGVQVLCMPFEYPAASPDGLRKDGTPVQFDGFRFAFLSKLRTSLRVFYDVVIMHDVDEILVSHPDTAKTVFQYINDTIARVRQHTIVGGIGVEIFQDLQTEGPIDRDRPILQQRRNAHFRLPEFKPVILCSDAPASPHGATVPFAIDPNLWLLHLKFIDRDSLCVRQQQRRGVVDRGEVPDWTRWGWLSTDVDQKLGEFLKRPLDADDSRGKTFLQKHFTRSSDGCYLVEKKQDRPPGQFDPAAGLTLSMRGELHDYRFILPPAFQALEI